MRFWRDGLGLQQLVDRTVRGGWPDLFGSRTDKLRSIFLADPEQPDSALVELVVFEGAAAGEAVPAAPRHGFFLLSFTRDVEETLGRLAALGLARDVRQIRQWAGTGKYAPMAVVTAPDGILVELIGAVEDGAA